MCKPVDQTALALAKTIKASLGVIRVGSHRLTADSPASQVKSLADEAGVLSSNLSRFWDIVEITGDLFDALEPASAGTPGTPTGVVIEDVTKVLRRMAMLTDFGPCPVCGGVLLFIQE